MATIAKKIIPGTQLPTSASAQYTTPANTRTLIKKLTFTNTTTNARLVTLYLVSSGGSAGSSSMLSYEKTLAPKETWEAYEAEGHILEPGDSIQAFSDAAASVTVHGSGIELV